MHRFLPLFAILLSSHPAWSSTVRVATVHYAPVLGDVAANRERIVELTEAAARNGARIVVHTEMATSGYSFFSRREIAAVAETIPGETTRAVGAVARKHGIYVVIGMPEYSPDIHSYFNSAALIAPDGEVLGAYRKRNNLLEASYNAAVHREVPVFDTPYGRLAVVICADMFYPHFPRAAAVAGAQILLAPANVGISIRFMRVRTFENGFAMVVANRYGTGTSGADRDYFNQETFTISSPFAYAFEGARSVIVDADGTVLVDVSGDSTQIAYADVPLGPKRPFPVVRKPSTYSLIAQDTLEPYVRSNLGLPEPGVFVAAAIDPGPSPRPAEAAAQAIEAAHKRAIEAGDEIRLAVLPEAYLEGVGEEDLAAFKALSARFAMDILVNAVDGEAPVSVLVAPDGRTYSYGRTHRRRTSAIPDSALSDDFWVVNRDYARVAISQGADMLAPETTLVLAKMGVDVIAVSADDGSAVLDDLWPVRTGNYVHIVVANSRGQEGIFLGGYRAQPSQATGEGTVMMQVDTSHVRDKKLPRFFDYHALLERCGPSNC